MSSVFDKFRGNNMMQDIQRLKENPAEIADMLYNTGKITKEQYQHIKGMNPKDICMYLMQSNPNFQNAVSMMRMMRGK